MGKDDIKHDLDSQLIRESPPRRHREQSFEVHNSEASSYPKRSYRTLCVRKISLKYDVDSIEEHLRDAFSPYGNIEIRIFKSSERRLAIIYFR